MSVGELYKRLVVLPPKKYHSYYRKVKDTLAEAKAEFPYHHTMVDGDEVDWEDAMVSWFKRWLGDV